MTKDDLIFLLSQTILARTIPPYRLDRLIVSIFYIRPLSQINVAVAWYCHIIVTLGDIKIMRSLGDKIVM